jgi:hypothetical protein
MKEPGDLLLQQRDLTWFDAGNGMLEELPLNMGRRTFHCKSIAFRTPSAVASASASASPGRSPP